MPSISNLRLLPFYTSTKVASGLSLEGMPFTLLSGKWSEESWILYIDEVRITVNNIEVTYVSTITKAIYNNEEDK